MNGIGQPDVLIVGSGPAGATYARLVHDRLPDTKILMVELGSPATDPPGLNIRNLKDAASKDRARRITEGGQPTEQGSIVPIIEGTVTAREGMHLVAPGSTFPAAALATGVGGQATLWTCATPRPFGSERMVFIDSDEWEAAIAAAERLLATTRQLYLDNVHGKALLAALSAAIDASLPVDRRAQVLPAAAREQADGTVVWTGIDTILHDLCRVGTSSGRSFELRPDTQCRRLDVDDGIVTRAVLRDRRSNDDYEVRPGAVVIAADALRSPQLLWASEIRPSALGRYLNEHPLVMSVIALDPARIDGLDAAPLPYRPKGSDPVMSVLSIPFSEPAHPFGAQLMHYNVSPVPLEPSAPDASYGYAAFGYGCRQEPRETNRVWFDDSERDGFDMPAMHFDYELSPNDQSELDQALAHVHRIGSALGEFVAGPMVAPPGSSFHYQGTVRAGPTDDGTSVCDPYGRVWGHRNLFVAGNGLIATATVCNPTLTNVAMAVRGADAVVQMLSSAPKTGPRKR